MRSWRMHVIYNQNADVLVIFQAYDLPYPTDQNGLSNFVLDLWVGFEVYLCREKCRPLKIGTQSKDSRIQRKHAEFSMPEELCVFRLTDHISVSNWAGL